MRRKTEFVARERVQGSMRERRDLYYCANPYGLLAVAVCGTAALDAALQEELLKIAEAMRNAQNGNVVTLGSEK